VAADSLVPKGAKHDEVDLMFLDGLSTVSSQEETIKTEKI
jgi:hypothetical protein